MDTTATPKRKVIALVRASTKEQDMERQHIDIQFHCERFGLEVVNTYPFDGITGVVVQNKPQFKAMLAEMSAPGISGVVLSTLDRFFRPENLDAYGTFKIFRTAKKLLFCDATRPLDVTNPEDRSLIVAQLENAAMERQRIKFRTHGKKEQLIQDPTVSITKLPKGVRHVKDVKQFGPKTKKGWFEYTPFAFESVKPAFEAVAEGSTIRGAAIRFGFVNETSLRIVLENKWWLGILERTHKRIVTYDDATGKKTTGPRVRHEKPYVHSTNLADTPLVPMELWNKVQNILQANHKTWTAINSNANAFLGTKFLHCECGCKMYLKFDIRQGKPPIYICSSYRTKQGVCGASRIKAEATDEAIWKAAMKCFKNPAYMIDALIKAIASPEASERINKVAIEKKHLEELEARKKRLVRMYDMDGDEDAFTRLNAVKTELAESKLRLANFVALAGPSDESEIPALANAIEARFEGSESWDVATKINALSEIVERITIDHQHRAIFVIRGGLPLQGPVNPMDNILLAHAKGLVENLAGANNRMSS
jgi:DNA invertase Pin-like site-specific DNA recombinase